MSKHTPGPWHFQMGGAQKNWPEVVASDRYELLARTYGPHERENAALIAAAPTLLDGCKAALAALSQNATYPADIEAAKNWLTKAIAAAEAGQ